jgi:FAD/FMN-containing dehydrogenase
MSEMFRREDSGKLGYESSVANVNLLYHFSRLTCVVQPESPFHIQKNVKRAKSQSIPIMINNSGHSCSGSSMTDKGILLDLSKMDKGHLDLESKSMT